MGSFLFIVCYRGFLPYRHGLGRQQPPGWVPVLWQPFQQVFDSRGSLPPSLDVPRPFKLVELFAGLRRLVNELAHNLPSQHFPLRPTDRTSCLFPVHRLEAG